MSLGFACVTAVYVVDCQPTPVARWLFLFSLDPCASLLEILATRRIDE